MNNYQDITSLVGHSGWLQCISFSHNSNTLASADAKTIYVWNMLNYQYIAMLTNNDNDITCIAISNEKIVASGSNDTTIRLWNILDHKCMATLLGHTDGVTYLTFSPTEHIIAVVAHNHTIYLWNTLTHRPIKKLINTSGWTIKNLRFSSNAKKLISVTSDGIISVWNITTDAFILEKHHPLWQKPLKDVIKKLFKIKP